MIPSRSFSSKAEARLKSDPKCRRSISNYNVLNLNVDIGNRNNTEKKAFLPVILNITQMVADQFHYGNYSSDGWVPIFTNLNEVSCDFQMVYFLSLQT